MNALIKSIQTRSMSDKVTAQGLLTQVSTSLHSLPTTIEYGGIKLHCRRCPDATRGVTCGKLLISIDGDTVPPCLSCSGRKYNRNKRPRHSK